MIGACYYRPKPQDSLSTQDSSKKRFLIYDGNGNITDYITANGTNVAHYEYGPFGGTSASSGTKADDFTHRFSTKPWDSTTGQVEFELRKYIVDLARWGRRDGAGEMAGRNLYGFVANNSQNLIELLGERPVIGIDDEGNPIEFPYPPPTPTPPRDPLADVRKKFMDWYNAQQDVEWMNEVPKCPCNLVLNCRYRPDYSTPGVVYQKAQYYWALPDEVDEKKWGTPNRLNDYTFGGPFVERYHPGASLTVRSKKTKNGYTNQCMYDDKGKLITEPPAAGTIDKQEGGHQASDVKPVMWAAMLDGQWDGDAGPMLFGRIKDGASGKHLDMYYEKRPPWHDNCEKHCISSK